MIFILCDEAAAFDSLSILLIKEEKNITSDRSLFDKMCDLIMGQIDRRFFYEILASSEFAALKKANEKTFEAVEMAKTDGCTAKYVDNQNIIRYKAKRVLQEKFFPKVRLTEIKS